MFIKYINFYVNIYIYIYIYILKYIIKLKVINNYLILKN